MTENLNNFTDIEKARFNMIEQQVRPWDVLDKEILDVMHAIPREVFVPENFKGLAFADAPIDIGEGQVMLPPVIVGRMLQALQVNEGDQVLQIGAGGGYITACMAQKAAHVTVVDAHREISKNAGDALAEVGVENSTIITSECHNGYGNQSYDVIVITAALGDVPETYLRQLKIGGRLFVVSGEAPVMEAQLITRVDNDDFNRESLFETALPDLPGVVRNNDFQL